MKMISNQAMQYCLNWMCHLVHLLHWCCCGLCLPRQDKMQKMKHLIILMRVTLFCVCFWVNDKQSKEVKSQPMHVAWATCICSISIVAMFICLENAKNVKSHHFEESHTFLLYADVQAIIKTKLTTSQCMWQWPHPLVPLALLQICICLGNAKKTPYHFDESCTFFWSSLLLCKSTFNWWWYWHHELQIRQHLMHCYPIDKHKKLQQFHDVDCNMVVT